MYYNINYEICSVVILLLIIVINRKHFKSVNSSIRGFMSVLILTLVTCVSNIFAALCYDNFIQVTDKGMLIVETAYLLLATYSIYAQVRVICDRVKYESESFRTLNFILMIFITIFLIVNVGPGFIFKYVNHVFVGSELFSSIYLLYFIFFLEMFVVIIIKRNEVRRRVLILTSFIFIAPAICIALQFFNDRLLLSGIGVSLAYLIFSFTLGDQDFKLLEETLQDLENSKDAEKKSRQDAEVANRVKSLFMEKISGELEQPIEQVLSISQEIYANTDQEKVREYSKEITEAGNQLYVFIDELLKVARGENGL